jgi:hypothetical protein
VSVYRDRGDRWRTIAELERLSEMAASSRPALLHVVRGQLQRELGRCKTALAMAQGLGADEHETVRVYELASEISLMQLDDSEMAKRTLLV